MYDSYTWIEDTCQAAQDLINGFLWFDSAPVVGTALVNNVATVMIANPGLFTTGQSVTVAGAGTTFNGTYTITGTVPFSSGTSNLLPAFNLLGLVVTAIFSLLPGFCFLYEATPLALRPPVGFFPAFFCHAALAIIS